MPSFSSRNLAKLMMAERLRRRRCGSGLCRSYREVAGLAREPLKAQPSSSVKDGASSTKLIHNAIHHLHSP